MHFERSGDAKLKRNCTLPLTAGNEVDYVVTDLGFFEIADGKFVLKEYFAPYTVDFILSRTDADIVVPEDCKEVTL